MGVHAAELADLNVENVLFDRIVNELTKPRPGAVDELPAGARRPDDIVFEGTFDEINEYFRSQLWSDELPVIPPTPERVGGIPEAHKARAG